MASKYYQKPLTDREVEVEKERNISHHEWSVFNKIVDIFEEEVINIFNPCCCIQHRHVWVNL